MWRGGLEDFRDASLHALREETGYRVQPPDGMQIINGSESPVNQDAALSKEAVDYSPGKGEDRCDNCTHWRGNGVCELVSGEIDPSYWCKKFAVSDAMATDRAPSPELRAKGREGLAMDRKPASESVRAYDVDGRLHVEISNISKANVCPYIGREIPKWKDLGLDPDRVYQMFRDPAELEKAAATFNNLPILTQHVPVTAENHQPELVVGSTGTDATFEEPYLRNSLVVWAKPAIEAIESDKRKELSCAYRYRADMTPGAYEGQKYDGVMRGIVGNHVALVKDGRAGEDIVVGDSMERLIMSKHVLSRKAAVAQGALLVHLAPRMAQDAKLDLGEILKDVTVKNWGDMKSKILEAVQPSMAQDASPEALRTLLDSLDSVGPESEDQDPPLLPPDAEGSVAEGAAVPEGQNAGDDDTEIHKKIVEFLQSKLSPEDLEAVVKLIGSEAGGAAPVEAEAAPVAEPKTEGEEAPAAGAQDENEDDMVTKTEMQGAMDEAVKRVRGEQKAIRDAERAVKPWVGELEMSFDSAPQVFRKTLDILKVDTKGVPDEALSHILKAQPLPADATKKKDPVFAMDAAAVDSYSKMFPTASRIGAA